MWIRVDIAMFSAAPRLPYLAAVWCACHAIAQTLCCGFRGFQAEVHELYSMPEAAAMDEAV